MHWTMDMGLLTMAQTCKLLILRLSIGLLFSISTTTYAQGYDTLTSSLKSQLELVEAWLPGNFDNNEQIVQQSGGGFGTPVYEPLGRTHMLYEKTGVPELGDSVFYVRIYRNNDSEDLLDQGLLVAEIDRAAKGVRLSMYRPAAMSASILTAADLPDAVSQWQRGDTACDIILRYEGAQLVGHNASNACRDSAKTDAKGRVGQLNTEMILSNGGLWFRESVRGNKASKTVSKYPADDTGYVQLRRADWYNCVVLYNLEGKMEEAKSLTRVTLHSQGGDAEIDWPDGRKIIMNIQTREFWTPRDGRSLMLRVMEAGNPVPLAYSYSDIPTKRMGINTGWFYTRCAVSSEQVF
jgi:hypothetical protein